MADQRKWFKVWTAILSDDDFDPSRGLISVGRFTMLGAYTALHGEKGVVEIMPDTLFRITETHTLDELRCELAFKNVTFEEGKNRHGKITVTWAKWVKYQEDSTQAQRAHASRSKKRREEMRGDEKRREEIKESEPPAAAPVYKSVDNYDFKIKEMIGVFYKRDKDLAGEVASWAGRQKNGGNDLGVILLSVERFWQRVESGADIGNARGYLTQLERKVWAERKQAEAGNHKRADLSQVGSILNRMGAK